MATERRQLRRVFQVLSGATPDSGRVEFWDGDICWVTPADMGRLVGYRLTDTARKITREGYENCGTTLAPHGSVVLTKRAPIGQLAVLDVDACSNQGCFLLTPRGAEDTRYYYYWLLASVDYLIALGQGSTFMELSSNSLKAIRIPHPPSRKQHAVADFLDRETARIDELIAAKQRLLEILSEKRRALISHAATKGLDPKVQMKDSGVEWLGQIPEHWQVERLKFRATVNDEVLEEDTPPDHEILYVDISGVDAESGVKTKDPMLFCDAPSRARRKVSDGDTVLSTVRTYLRAIAAVRHPEPNLIVSTGFAVIRPRRVESDFLAWSLRSSYFIETVVSRSVGVSYPAINASEVMDIPVAIPARPEQRAIVAHIEAETAKLDALRAAAERTIDLLKERRAALISAAVTGQIDVASGADSC